MNKTPTHVSINCRLPKDVHTEMSSLLDCTGKTVAAFMQHAVVEYVQMIRNPKMKPSKQLQIDQFAYKIQKGSE